MNEKNIIIGAETMIGGDVNVKNIIVESGKSMEEIQLEKITLFRNACKRAYEDLILTDQELFELEDLRQTLGIDSPTASSILESVRQLASGSVMSAPLTGVARLKLRQFSNAILQNDESTLLFLMDSIAYLTERKSMEVLHFRYYLVCSAFEPETCIGKYEKSSSDDYWLSYWAYMAYVNTGRLSESEKLLIEMGDKFSDYPEENLILLAAAGAYNQYGVDAAKEYLSEMKGNISTVLQRFMDALFASVFPESASKLGDRSQYAFYVKHMLLICADDAAKADLSNETPVPKQPSDISYLLSEDGKTLVALLDTEATEFDIPHGVEIIGDEAFEYCESLRKIHLAETVRTLGKRAFAGCSSLQAIVIPSSVTTLEYEAFFECPSLERMVLSSSVTTINDCAFQDCTSLKEIVIPSSSSVTTIGVCAFDNCTSLKEIVIPPSVTSIGDYAFSGCSSLESITIPSSVTTIGECAFENCTSLKEIVIPSSVTTIGDGAFYYISDKSAFIITSPSSIKSDGNRWLSFDACLYLPREFEDRTVNWLKQVSNEIIYVDMDKKSPHEMLKKAQELKALGEKQGIQLDSSGRLTHVNNKALTEIIIPKGVTEICSNAFLGCSSLESITIPSSVTTINDCAFQDCTSLKEIVIPSSVTTIGEWAFLKCISLKKIVIPSSVTTIGGCAFRSCTSLKEIVIPSSSSVTTIGECAFDNCTSLKEIVIPSSVTTIGNYAFRSCTSLKEIVIPPSVTSIGDHAFSDCSSLESITIPSSVTTIGMFAFSGCSSMLELIIVSPSSIKSVGVCWLTLNYACLYFPREFEGMTAGWLNQVSHNKIIYVDMDKIPQHEMQRKESGMKNHKDKQGLQIDQSVEAIKQMEEERKKAEEEQKMAEAKAKLEEENRKKEEAERLKQEEENRKKAEAKAKREALKKNKEEEKALFASRDVDAYVDLGLSVKWATCNIGASMPIEQGDFYAWGEIMPKRYYQRTTYVFYDETHDLNTKYQAKTEVLVAKHLLRKNEYLTMGDDKTTLEKCDDVANKKLLGNWRMPTAQEFQELIKNCKWTWTTINEVKGYKVQSNKQGYTDKSIFLPACGYFRIDKHIYSGEEGNYWSSNRSAESEHAKMMNFTKKGVDANDKEYRCYGMSIRPVKE